MKDLTFVCSYYENRGMLVEQQKIWAAYPPELRARFHAIITDDCSAKPFSALPVFEPAPIASYRLFRASVQRRWDWLFCRNLGVEKATTEWVLLTDIDHVLSSEALGALLSGQPLTGHQELHLSSKGATATVTMPLDPDYIFRFSRVDAHHARRADNDHCQICARAARKYIERGCEHGPLGPYTSGHIYTPYKAHPNSWLMTRAMFDQMGGYDERFSGFYGSDSDFRERCKAVPFDYNAQGVPINRADTKPAKGVIRLDVPLIRYPRESIPDASTTSYQRKAQEDAVNVPLIKAARAKIHHWRPLRLTIPYTLEASC